MNTCVRCGRDFESDVQGLCPRCVFAFAVDQTEAPAPPAVKSSSAIDQDLPGIKLLSLIGQGGMGKVYKALQVGTGRTVAVKILAEELAADEKFVSRFVSEARAMGRLNHPNIVAAYDANSAGNKHYLVMEFVEGSTCEQLLAKQHKRFPQDLVVSIGLQAAEALDHAAQHKIVHRDIKPGNLMLAKNGVVKLCDLGIAQRGDSREMGLTTLGTSIGTPLYMSPEQAAGKKVDSRSDIYSLGATLFHLATGRPPFQGANIRGVITQHLTAPVPNPRQFAPHLSEAFAAVIMKMLEKDPEDRYQTPKQVAEEFERIQKGRSVVAATRLKRGTMRHVRAVGARHGTASRSRAGLLAAAGVLVAVAVVAVVALSQNSRPSAVPRTVREDRPKPPTPPPPPVVEDRPGIEVQIAEFWKRAEGYLAAPVENQIREPYEMLRRHISAASYVDRPRWEEIVPQYLRKAHDTVLADPWNELQDNARKAIAAGKFDEAERLLDTWPVKWRYFDEARQVPTPPETERMAMLKDVRFQRVKGVDDLVAQIEKLTREGQFAQAWDLYPKLKEMAPSARAEQTALGLVRSHIGSATTGTLTQQSVEHAWTIAQDIKARNPIDQPIHRAVDDIMKAVETGFEKVIVKAEERFRQILEAFDKEFAQMMRARRYRDSRLQIAKILQAEDPLLAPIRYESLVSLGRMLQDPAKSAPDLLEHVRRFLPPPTAPAQTMSLLRDIRAVLHLEVLCLRAVDGLKDSASNSKRLAALEHVELSKATRVTVKQIDTAGLGPIRATVTTAPGNQNVIVPFSPDESGALPITDLLDLASFGGTKDDELKLTYMLLAHFAGDRQKAAEKAYGLMSDLVSHYGITPSAPVASAPPPKGLPSGKGLEARVDWKGSKEVGEKGRSRVRFRFESDPDSGPGQTGRVTFEGETGDLVVTEAKGKLLTAHLPDEFHKKLSKGDLVRVEFDPKPAPAPTANGFEAQKRRVEELLSAALRERSEAAVDAVYAEFNENAKRDLSREGLLRIIRRSHYAGEFQGLSQARPAGERAYEYTLHYRWVQPTVYIEFDEAGKVNKMSVDWPDVPGWGQGGGGGPGGVRRGRGR